VPAYERLKVLDVNLSRPSSKHGLHASSTGYNRHQLKGHNLTMDITVYKESSSSPDTVWVISEAVFAANCLTDTDQNNSGGKVHKSKCQTTKHTKQNSLTNNNYARHIDTVYVI